jgi:hypothetical protein
LTTGTDGGAVEARLTFKNNKIMNYLKECTDRLLISIKGYKTPNKVIKKLKKKDFSFLIGNPKWHYTNTK